MGRRDTRRKRKRRARGPAPDPEKWRARTSAEVLTPGELTQRKADRGWYLAGIVGFAGRWRGPAAARKDEARALIRGELQRLASARGDALIVVSGATNAGVLAHTYAECVDQGITAMGITANQALGLKLAPMTYVVPVGQRFGDESEVFVAAIDEIIILGGGAQSMLEVRMAARRGLPLTVIQGFGGAADELSPDAFPGARFLAP